MNDDSKIVNAVLAWVLALASGMCISLTFGIIYNPAAGFSAAGVILLILALIAAYQTT